ncbi:hypothetical protein EV363DRAFT_1163739 [Boletus edulis]|uniref:Uncharacterized protein n=1 Tax=Boletus edulis BED1 TaxID=1328754 RepID=A0AAD4GH69_BOLED|nr:hypothetical protein EV363DRAFT_1163739 [Boletus edulis]KAF8444002.1 hypothetical protein L210DRAFT_948380 [Boletus edulis BED1]
MKQKRRSPRCFGNCNETLVQSPSHPSASCPDSTLLGNITIMIRVQIIESRIRVLPDAQWYSAFASLALKGSACPRSSTLHILC